MAEPVKNLFNKAFIHRLCSLLASHYSAFDQRGFEARLLDRHWQDKALKQRITSITVAMHEFLASDYETALGILFPVAQQMPDYKYVVFPEYVARYGLEHYDLSIDALQWFTRFSTAEFAVRPFIEKYPQQMMAQMLEWSLSDNHHVRRLASEGCRPRLPWATALSSFKKDPRPILPILENLKADDSLYVRKSVANNLNDISKDHPGRVLHIAEKWQGKHCHTDWIIKHGLRTLLKQGDRQALSLSGLQSPRHIIVRDFYVDSEVCNGGDLDFGCELQGENGQSLGALRIEFAISFARKSGRHSRKVFRHGLLEVAAASYTVKRSFSFRPLSTRMYYPGRHHLQLIVNGEVLAEQAFMLR